MVFITTPPRLPLHNMIFGRAHSSPRRRHHINQIRPRRVNRPDGSTHGEARTIRNPGFGFETVCGFPTSKQCAVGSPPDRNVGGVRSPERGLPTVGAELCTPVPIHAPPLHKLTASHEARRKSWTLLQQFRKEAARPSRGGQLVAA